MPEPLQVHGRATYREPIPAPDGAILSVSLEDVARSDVPAQLLDTKQFLLDEYPLPVDFALSTPHVVAPHIRLVVRANIRSTAGQLLWTTTSQHVVNMNGGDIGMIVLDLVGSITEAPLKKLQLTGHGNEPGWSITVRDGVAILQSNYGAETTAFKIEAQAEHENTRIIDAAAEDRKITIVQYFYPCVDDMSGAVTPYKITVQTGDGERQGCGGTVIEFLTPHEWVVEDINHGGIIDSSHLTINFDTDGQISGSTGCNHYSGGYKIAEGALEIGPLKSTERTCISEAAMLQEERMLGVLRGPLTMNLTPDGALILTAPSGGSLLARQS